jgi:hypothetical protein
MAPGFPQTIPPTRAEYQQRRHQQAQRNSDTKRDALETLAAAQSKAAHELANIAVPIGVTYSISALRNSGRLLDGMKLDLSGSSNTLIQQVEQLRSSIKEDILRELLMTTPSNGSAPPTVNPTPSSTMDSAEQPQAAAPGQTPAPVPATNPAPAGIVRHVAVTKQVQWGENSHLPYNAPANWQLFGKPSYAAVLKQPNQQPAARPAQKSALKKSAEAAKAAVTVALAMLVPAANAASPRSS